MKNRGFTLIELLSVLVILPLLVIIAYPAINMFLTQTENKYYDNLEKNIELAAIDFATDNRNFLPKGMGSYKRITIDQILKYGELEQITDKDGNVCEEGYVVIKKIDTADYEYTSCIKCGNYQTTNPECERNDSKYEVNYVLKHNNQNGTVYQEGTWSGTNIYQEFTNNQLYGVRLDTYQRQLDDGIWEDFSGNSFVLDTTNYVCVRAIDIDGNISEVSCYNVKIDKEPITVASKKDTFEYEYKSTEYNNNKIADLFTFGSFGRSGGTITCKAGNTILYKNNNGTVETNKKVSELGLAKSTTITCESITGANVKRSVTATVKITARSITTLNANGGTVTPTSIEVIYGEKYSNLPTPERSGYTFDGWYTASSGGTKITNSTTVNTTENQTLYARWKANEYTVTFNASGGSVSAASKSVTYDSTYGDLPTPTRTGYTFNGWYTEVTGGTKITSSTTVKITQNQTLYAHWSANEYTVTFDANGGSVSPTTKKVAYASTYSTLPNPTRSGHTFAGWYTSATGGTNITDTSLVQITSNQTLYAHWSANEYTVTFDANGGSVSPTTKKVVYASTYSTLPTPTRSGYTFGGWYTSVTGGTEITSSTKVSITSNQTLYAHWSANDYTYDIVYKSSSGTTLGTATATYNYGTTNTISPKSFTGYTNPSSQSIKWDQTSAKTITFIYTPISYSITYNLNSGTNPSGATTSYTIEQAVTLPTPTRSGYTFDGWYTSSNFSGNKVTSITKGTTGNKTYYAKWSANEYTVTFDAIGGTVSPTSKKVTYAGTYKDLPTPERTGYTFEGWYTEVTGGTKITSSSTVSITSNQTLYAHWTANEYTVTFDAIGGTVSPTSKKVTYASTYGTLPTPTRGGYTFAGWYTSKTGGTNITDTSIVQITAKQTLYAHWTANTYTYDIVYKSSSGTSLGTDTITKAFDTTNTVSPKAFTGYNTPSSQSIKWDQTNAKTITFTYTPTSYSITYNLNSGTNPSSAKTSYTIEQAVTLPTPTRTNYTFLGWYTNSSFTGSSVTNIPSGTTGDKTYYANWSINNYPAIREEKSYPAHENLETMCHCSCSFGDAWQGEGHCRWHEEKGEQVYWERVFFGYYCNEGDTLSGSTCINVIYTCPNGGTLSGTTCVF